MNIKSMIAAAAVVASTIASAATFQWTVGMNEGVSWDKLSCRIYSTDKVNFIDVDGLASKSWFDTGSGSLVGAPGTDGKFTFTKDGTSYTAGYLRFNFANGDTYVGNASKIGYQWASAEDIISWDAVLSAIRSNGTFTKDINYFNDKGSSLDWSKADKTIGTFTITPEPTSGLMLLLGAGMLALRRKAVRA